MADRKRTEPLSNVDTAWLRMEHPTNLMMITGVMMFDEPLDTERLRKTIEQGMLKRFPRFRQRLVNDGRGLRQPQWEDDPHFDIRTHIRRIALPAPGDEATLQSLVSDLMSTPLDFSKPLWQWHVVENYGTGCALITRLHHCIADGIALIHVMFSMTETAPDGAEQTKQAAPSRESAPKRSLPNPFTTLLRQVTRIANSTVQTTETVWNESIGFLSNPGRMLDLLQLGADSAATVGKLLTMSNDPPTVFKGCLGVTKRAVWSDPIPLTEIKAIGQVTKSTINDILLTTVTGALRRYLQHRGEKVDGLNIRSVVPINLRPLNETPELGNRFGLVFLALPIGIEKPLDRLIELQERMDAIKSSTEAIVAFGILNAIGGATAEIENHVLNIFGSKATAVMTNVPGPRQTLYLAGRAIRNMMFWVPQSGRVGLGVSIISYANNVYLGVATDVGLVADPEIIIAAFQEEFDQFRIMARQTEMLIARRQQAEDASEDPVPKPEPVPVSND
ncbi:MAG: wax ester/triacylglycerol synthase family O-acyltransferase [Chloroflexales bacterium]|nr:wax ester/triacylglycerol synthase family O-acyltransferase [Chloroflexales bacterium]